jgi:hypothetical protein
MEGRRFEAEFLEHHIEGAAIAAMAPEYAVDVEGCAAGAFGGPTGRNGNDGSKRCYACNLAHDLPSDLFCRSV